MSIHLMASVWNYDFPRRQQAVLMAMADHARDDGGKCFPSLGLVAWKTGYDKRHVRRIIRELEKVEVLVQVAEATRRLPVEYRIDLSKATKKPPYAPNVPPPDTTDPAIRGDISDNQGGHLGQSGGTPLPPEPLTGTKNKEPLTASADQQATSDTKSGKAGVPVEKSRDDSKQRLGKEDDPGVDAEIEELWSYYCELFNPSRPNLSASRARAIAKGFKEEFTLADLKLAVLGLFLWRKQKKGDRSISTIFTTYPGGQTLADRIQFFIDVAEKSGPMGSITSADPAIVARKQVEVQRGHRSTDEAMVQKANEAEKWLRQQGIDTVRDEEGYPTFEVRAAA